MQHARGCAGQQRFIVGDVDHRQAAGADEALQEVQCAQIQIVAGLVQQQEAWVRAQKQQQLQLDFFTARKRFHRAFGVAQLDGQPKLGAQGVQLARRSFQEGLALCAEGVYRQLAARLGQLLGQIGQPFARTVDLAAEEHIVFYQRGLI